MGLDEPRASSKCNGSGTQQQHPPKKREKAPKYPTIPADKVHQHFEKNQQILVSLISQSEYMKKHLFIKTGVEKDRSVFRYQPKKVSLRNYTPKTLNQEMNMGMWI